MNPRATVILIAVWTMIQALGYGVMAALAIQVHNCQYDMVDTRLSQLIYAIYFRDNICGPIDWALLLNEAPQLEPIMPDVTSVAFRTNIIAITYLAVSLLWVVTSFTLMVGSLISCLGKCGYYMFYYPWVWACILTVILDVVATGFFIYDLVNSFLVEQFLSHLEIENAQEIAQNIQYNDYLLTIPSVIMICAAARVFIFWILNIFFIFIVIRMGKELVFGVSSKDDGAPMRRVLYGYENEQSHNQPNTASELRERSRYSDQTLQQYQYDDLEYPREHLRAIDPKKQYDYTGRISNDDQQRSPRSLNSNNGNSKSSSHSKVVRSQTPSVDHAIDDGHRSPSTDKISYISGTSLLDEQKISIDRPHLRVSKTSSTKVPSQSNKDQIKRIDGRSSVNPTDELRGQLPWSYFKNRDDISGPKKTFTELREDEDLPPVPVPDYTLHFPRKDRPSRTLSDDGSR